MLKQKKPNKGEIFGNASEIINGHHAPEGIKITFTQEKDSLENVLKKLTWGIKSGMSYAGARYLHEMRGFGEFQLLRSGAREESKL